MSPKPLTHQPRKRFGQNFLIDTQIIHRIVSIIRPNVGEHLVEIGPGLGALTLPVLQLTGEMDVIELDRDVIPILKSHAEGLGELRIHSHDALSFDFSTLRHGPERLRVFGNLPYNISTPLMFHLLDQLDHIDDMHFMLQQEVVTRLAAAPGSKAYGRLSVMVQYFCDVEDRLTVPPESFKPAPKVMSAIVCLIPKRPLREKANDFTVFSDVVHRAFAHKRKTLRNNLKDLLSEDDLRENGINPNERAENLPLEAFIKISNWLGK